MENNLPPGTLIIPAASQFAMRKARELQQNADRINFQYAGAQVGSRARDFRSSSDSRTESQLLPYFDRLRIITRLRQLVRDDPYAAALLSAYPTQLGTSTMSSLESGESTTPGADDVNGAEAEAPAAAEFNDQHEEAWCEFTKRVEYCGLSLAEVEQIVWREDLIAGEVFFLKLKSGRLQMIPSEYCFSDYAASGWGNQNGAEQDGLQITDGVVTGYRFGYRDESGILQVGKSITPAENVIHFFFQDRPEQRRGVPRLSSVLNVLQDIFEICGAKVNQVKTQSFISGVVTKNYAPGDAADLMRNQNSDGTRSDYQDLRGGALYYLETGEDMKPFQSSINANDFNEFLKSRLEAIGGAVGMPPECWIEGFRDSNYSSARATVSTWIRTVQSRRSHLVCRFLEPVHDFWIEKNPAEVRSWGAGLDPTEIGFAFPGVPAIDESKQNDSDAKALAACLTTYAQVYGAKGQFWDTQFKQIQREKQKMLALGIEPNFAPNNSQQAAPMADTATEDPAPAPDTTTADAAALAAKNSSEVIELFKVSRTEMAELAAKLDAPKVITLDAARDELRATAKADQTIDALFAELKAKHST